MAAKFGERAKVRSLEGAQDVGALQGLARMVQDGDDHRHEARQHGRHRFPIRAALVARRQRKRRAAQDVERVGQGVITAIARPVEGRAPVDLLAQAGRRFLQTLGACVPVFRLRQVVDRVVWMEPSREEVALHLESGATRPAERHPVVGDGEHFEASLKDLGLKRRHQLVPVIDDLAVMEEECLRSDGRCVIVPHAHAMAPRFRRQLEVSIRVADEAHVIEPARIRKAVATIDRVGEGIPPAPARPPRRIRIERHDLAAWPQHHSRDHDVDLQPTGMGVRVHEDRRAQCRRNPGGGRLKEETQDLAGTLAVTASAGVELGDGNVARGEREGHQLKGLLERQPGDHRRNEIRMAKQKLRSGIPDKVDM